jgi:acyl-CoA thioesterase-1
MQQRGPDVWTRAARRHQHYFVAALCAWLALGCGPSAPASTAAARAPTADGREALETSVPSESEPEYAERPVVLFLGTSLTAGYGLPIDEAFPALVQQRIDEASIDYRVVNAGVSGDTSAGGLRRLDWLLSMPIAVLVLELGANDMLRGLGVDAMRENLRSILDRTRETHPSVLFVIAGMRAAPNLGEAYTEQFDTTFPELATQYDAQLIPFLLDGVAAVRRLNQPDGIHPTAEGHRIVADSVWQALEPTLRGGEPE